MKFFSLLSISLITVSFTAGTTLVFAQTTTNKTITHITLPKTSKPAPKKPLPIKKTPVAVKKIIATLSTTSSQLIPSGIDMKALNAFWVEQINRLRIAQNLRPLILDARFQQTATEWSGYMERVGSGTHTRPNGFTMHQWIATKGLDFTARNSPEGWKTNYFSENIAWGYVSNSTNSATSSLAQTIQFMLAEKASNGPHYRTIYYPDWNTVGAGFSFKPLGNGRYQMFSTFHYGSLKHPGASTSTNL